MFRTPLRAPLFLVLLAAPLAGQAPSAPEARPVLGVDPAYMDPAAPACKDFYRFANGAYDREPIPAAYAAFGVNEEIDQRNEVLLKDILSAAAKDLGAAPGSAARRIGDFYRSGMDLAAIERAGLQPLQPLLKRVAAMKSTRELGPVLALLHAQGSTGASAAFPRTKEKTTPP